MSVDLSDKLKKFKPSLLIKEGWTYYKLDGNEYVIALKGSLGRVEQLHNKDGTPVIHPQSKFPMFNFDAEVKIQIMTIEDFNKIQKSSFGLD